MKSIRKIGFNDMRKFILKNNNMVILSKINVLLFMVPTHVFASEKYRDKFVEALNNNY